MFSRTPTAPRRSGDSTNPAHPVGPNWAFHRVPFVDDQVGVRKHGVVSCSGVGDWLCLASNTILLELFSHGCVLVLRFPQSLGAGIVPHQLYLYVTPVKVVLIISADEFQTPGIDTHE